MGIGWPVRKLGLRWLINGKAKRRKRFWRDSCFYGIVCVDMGFMRFGFCCWGLGFCGICSVCGEVLLTFGPVYYIVWLVSHDKLIRIY